MIRKALVFLVTWTILIFIAFACVFGYSALCIAVDSVAGAL